MIFLYFFLSFFTILIDGNDKYHIGIINHNIQWNIFCPLNSTRTINPPLNDQPLISYQCPYGTLPIDIVPNEVDFTFLCRLQSRLIWIIVDIYQYNDWLWSKNIETLNISIIFNKKILVKDSKTEIHNYKNRFILINAYYIPFESLDILLNETIDIFIRINQCQFYIQENLTWNEMIYKESNLTESKTLLVQYAQCDFYPKLIPIDDNSNLEIDDNTTDIPDFHVVLSVDQQIQTIETTTMEYPDYYLLINEQYEKLSLNLSILTRTTNLITYIFIFTIIIFIFLIIFFVYMLCYHYHYHSRSKQKSPLLI